MPTGYTRIIEGQGDVTLAQFAMRCARGMMPLISLRDVDLDEPIPSKLKANPHYAERVAECEQRLAQISAMTVQDAASLLETRHAERVAEVERWNTTRLMLQANCERLRADVDAWMPPTPDHAALKKFMFDQLDDEIDHVKVRLDLPAKQSPEQWLAVWTEDAHKELERAKRDLVEELQRTDWNNKWLADLRKSVGATTPYRTAAE